MHRQILAVALLAGAALPAAAQDRPTLFPTRDVTVTYRTLGAAQPGTPQSITMAWQAESQRFRSDLPGMGWMVADQRAGQGFLVMEQMRAVMDIPLGQAMAQHGPAATATFRREGTDTVAGHACTVWSYQDPQHGQGRACITADGVMLRAQGSQGGQSGGMEATQVAYGALDPARFQKPAGYQTMQMPGQGGAMRPPAR